MQNKCILGVVLILDISTIRLLTVLFNSGFFYFIDSLYWPVHIRTQIGRAHCSWCLQKQVAHITHAYTTWNFSAYHHQWLMIRSPSVVEYYVVDTITGQTALKIHDYFIYTRIHTRFINKTASFLLFSAPRTSPLFGSLWFWPALHETSALGTYGAYSWPLGPWLY